MMRLTRLRAVGAHAGKAGRVSEIELSLEG